MTKSKYIQPTKISESFLIWCSSYCTYSKTDSSGRQRCMGTCINSVVYQTYLTKSKIKTCNQQKPVRASWFWCSSYWTYSETNSLGWQRCMGTCIDSVVYQTYFNPRVHSCKREKLLGIVSSKKWGSYGLPSKTFGGRAYIHDEDTMDSLTSFTMWKVLVTGMNIINHMVVCTVVFYTWG